MNKIAHPIVLAISLGVLCLIASQVFFCPEYQTPDDPFIELIASGTLAFGEPSEMLVTAHFLYGRMLCILNGMAPEWPWHYLCLLTIQFVSISWIAVLMLRKATNHTACFLAVVYLCAAHLILAVRPQYTMAAAIAAQAGIYGVLDQLQQRKLSVACLVIGSLAIGLGAVIRFDASAMMLLLSAPLFLFSSVEFGSQTPTDPARLPTCNRGRAFIRNFVAFACLCATAQLINWHNQKQYDSNPRWHNFLEYFWLTHDFNAADAKTANAVAISQGWTPAEVSIVRSFFGFDMKAFGIDRLRTVVPKIMQTNNFSTPMADVIADAVLQVRNPVKLLLLSFVTLSTICLIASTRTRWMGISLVLVTVLTYFYLAAGVRRFPDRVAIPFFLFLGGLWAIYPQPPFVWTSNSRSVALVRNAFLLGLCALIFVVLGYMHAKSVAARSHQDCYAQCIRELKTRPGAIYVVWIDKLPIQFKAPITSPANFYGSLQVITAGWLAGSPLIDDRLKEFEIDDIYHDVTTRPDLWLVGRPKQFETFKELFQQRYGSEVNFTTATTFDCLGGISVQKPIEKR